MTAPWRCSASGALAGLAGGVEVSGVSYALFQNLSPGYGFTAIAVALLARLHPLGVVATGLLFGALEAGAGAMQRDAGVPAVAVYVVEAVVISWSCSRPPACRRRRRATSGAAARRHERTPMELIGGFLGGRGAGGDAAPARRDRRDGRPSARASSTSGSRA